jgi:hypothetical protein
LPDQLTLFADAPVRPEGLRYDATLTSRAVERELIAQVATLPLQPFQFRQYEGKRRVASFGWRYDYSQRRLVPAASSASTSGAAAAGTRAGPRTN